MGLKKDFTRQFGDILDFDVGRESDGNHLNLTRLHGKWATLQTRLFYFLYTTGTHGALLTHGQTLDLKIAPSVTKFPRNVAIGSRQTYQRKEKTFAFPLRSFYFDPFSLRLALPYVERNGFLKHYELFLILI